MIVFRNFPLPPSVNHCYPTFRGRRVRSVELKKFIKRAEEWKRMNMRSVLDAEREISDWNRRGLQLCVDRWFCFEESRVYSQTSTVKALDATNFVKPLDDVLADLLLIDDRHFFAGIAEKVTTKSKEEECTIIEITPHLPQSKDSILLSLKTTADGALPRSQSVT